MQVRLAFAVAAHLEPEVLLIDEVLAVGDAEFQKKCLGKMSEATKQGRTVLFVSHNMLAVADLCPRSLWLEQGQIVARGATDEIIDAYLGKYAPLDTSHINYDTLNRDSRFEITEISLLDDTGEPVKRAISGQTLTIELAYQSSMNDVLRDFKAQLIFREAKGRPLFACQSGSSRKDEIKLPPQGVLRCRIPHLPLLPDEYIVGLECKIIKGTIKLAWDVLFRLEVSEGDFFGTGRLPFRMWGPMLVHNQWQAVGAEERI